MENFRFQREKSNKRRRGSGHCAVEDVKGTAVLNTVARRGHSKKSLYKWTREYQHPRLLFIIRETVLSKVSKDKNIYSFDVLSKIKG
jgi:hypothetical protein